MDVCSSTFRRKGERIKIFRPIFEKNKDFWIFSLVSYIIISLLEVFMRAECDGGGSDGLEDRLAVPVNK